MTKWGRDKARERYDSGGRIRRATSPLGRANPSAAQLGYPEESLDFPPKSKSPGYVFDPNPAGPDTENSQFSSIPRRKRP